MASLIPISPSAKCQTGECSAAPKMALLDDSDEVVTVHCNRHAVRALTEYSARKLPPELPTAEAEEPEPTEPEPEKGSKKASDSADQADH